MGYAQKLATEGIRQEATVYELVAPKAKKRKIAWERILFPVLLLASVTVYRQNVSMENRLHEDMKTVFSTDAR